MKRSMTLAAGVLGLVTGMAGAQQPTPNAAADRERINAREDRRARMEAEFGEKLMSVSFSGGTIGQYVEALRKAAPDGSANVVVSERASKVSISEIKLKDVSLGVAINSIPAAYSGPRGAWRLGPVGNQTFVNGQTTIGFPQGQFTAANTTYSVDFETVSDFDSGMQVDSFSLARLLNPGGMPKQDGNVDAALTAVETGLNMLTEHGESRADLKFHPDSSLLFVRGTRAQVQLVGSVVSRMTEEATRRATLGQRRQRAEQLRELTVREAKLQIGMWEVEMDNAAGELDRQKKAFEAGQSSAQELARAKSNVVRAQLELERAKIKMERAQLGDSADEQPAAAEEPAGDGSVTPQGVGAPGKANPPSTKRPGR